MSGDISQLPRLLFTMGDVAGVGPEIIVKAWPELTSFCRPIVVGDQYWLDVAVRAFAENVDIQSITHPEDARPSPTVMPLLQASANDLRGVKVGQIDACAGQASYDFLCTAIDATMQKRADAIVTAPLHKEALHRAGVCYPGHTEILAEKTGATRFAMMLYAPESLVPHGLGVVHVTLHMPLRKIFDAITTDAILEKITLLHHTLKQLLRRQPRIGVCGLNPHAGDNGLFGDEEAKIIRPAVETAISREIQATGPLPSDTLFVAAKNGDYDGIVAMYHDQGHIALKLLTNLNAVNVTLGLPIVRTSVAHGTAYDIAGKGVADHRGVVHAAQVAARLVQ